MSKKQNKEEQKAPVITSERLTGYTPEVKFGVSIPKTRRARGSKILALLEKLPVTPQDGSGDGAHYEVPRSQIGYYRLIAKREGIKVTTRSKMHVTGLDSDQSISLIWRH